MEENGSCLSAADRTCNTCSTVAFHAEEAIDEGYREGECYIIRCSNVECRKSWIYCRSCKKKLSANNRLDHPKAKRHKKNSEKLYPPKQSITSPTQHPPTPGFEEYVSKPADEDSVAAMDESTFVEQMDKDLSTCYIEGADSSLATSKPIKEGPSKQSQFPLINIEGNEWLEEVFKDHPRATIAEMHSVFSGPQLEHMKTFWMAELATGVKRCGGGLSYLVARAFQQAKDLQLDKKMYPGFQEAKWHLENLIQHHSMTQKQRKRQARITKAIMDDVEQRRGKFFKCTFIPDQKHINKYYGTGQYSIWSSLPIPRPVDVGGVAYCSPKAIVAFAMANGIPTDDIWVTPSSLNRARST